MKTRVIQVKEDMWFTSRQEGLNYVRACDSVSSKVEKSSKGSKYVKLICKQHDSSRCAYKAVLQRRQQRRKKSTIPPGAWYVSSYCDHTPEAHPEHLIRLSNVEPDSFDLLSGVASIRDIQEAVVWLQDGEARSSREECQLV